MNQTSLAKRCFLPLLFAVSALALSASQIRFPINPATSRLNALVCVQGTCGSDTSPVTGHVTAAFDRNGLPRSISVRDYDIRATRTLHIVLNYGFLGTLTADAHRLAVTHARRGPTNEIGGVTNSQFNLFQVPYRVSGTSSYVANGGICLALQSSGQPCAQTNNLATSVAPGVITNLVGTITVSNGLARLVLDMSFDEPLDAANPTLGTLVGTIHIEAAANVNLNLLPAGDDWRYFDAGQDLLTGWHFLNYDDTSWNFGPAQLGFGDGDEAHVLNGGPPQGRFPTTYLRHAFPIENSSLITNLHLRLLADDGAIVYLNGNEIFRKNLPGVPGQNDIDFTELATEEVSGPAENEFVTIPANNSLLDDGINVVAVELHQADPFGPDLSFDLELLANAIFPSNAPPRLALAPVPGGFWLTWPGQAPGYAPEFATQLAPANWQLINSPYGYNAGRFERLVPGGPGPVFFRLRR